MEESVLSVIQDAHRDILTSVEFSYFRRYLVTGSDDDTVKLWEFRTAKELQSLGTAQRVKSVVVSPHTKFICIGTTDRTVKIWK